MENKKINLKEKFTKINEYWSPRVITEMNNYQFKLAKIKGEFIWQPFAEKECQIMLVEPKEIINTGKIINDFTSPNDIWV